MVIKFDWVRSGSASCGWRMRPSSRFQQRDEGVPRRPGGPPYLRKLLL